MQALLGKPVILWAALNAFLDQINASYTHIYRRERLFGNSDQSAWSMKFKTELGSRLHTTAFWVMT
jgi:hypothetical protein